MVEAKGSGHRAAGASRQATAERTVRRLPSAAQPYRRDHDQDRSDVLHPSTVRPPSVPFRRPLLGSTVSNKPDTYASMDDQVFCGDFWRQVLRPARPGRPMRRRPPAAEAEPIAHRA